MRLLPFLLPIVSLAAAIQDPAPISGRWLIEMSIAGNESTQSCTFTQTGPDLNGTCESSGGAVKIAGKVDGKEVAWSYKTEYNGNPLTVACDGAIASAGKISGTVNVPEYGVEGTFTATAAK